MTLSEYYLLFGDAGLDALAAACSTKRSYLLQLIYSPGMKEPSLTMAVALCKASGGRLTCELLCRGAATDHRTLRRAKKAAAES